MGSIAIQNTSGTPFTVPGIEAFGRVRQTFNTRHGNPYEEPVICLWLFLRR
jgi:hypothetical protein